MNKQRLLFVMNNLHCGGAEKALVSLLQTIDYTRFEVDLLLFRKEGLFLNQVPATVTILEAPQSYAYFDGSFIRSLGTAFFKLRWDIIWNRIGFTRQYKKERHAAIREQKVWRYISATMPPLKSSYDLAIGFLEKMPTYYIVEKVNATCKVGFVHNDYEKLGMDSQFDLPYFQKLDAIATISESCLASLQRQFPTLSSRLLIIQNISSPSVIQQLAEATIPPMGNGLKLVTIGRLDPQKGYDLLIEAALYLKQRQLAFTWSILGDGGLKANLLEQIKTHDLQEHIVFLGIQENPYPYLKQCDIYVQTSRFEGKSVAIDEAKILQKPIIVTNFSTAKDQITDGYNGSIVDMAGIAIAKGILDLSANPSLQAQFRLQLAKEKMGNEEEVEKIYQFAQSERFNK